MTKEAKKFKKVRLFKVSRELNVTVDTLVDHLKEVGHAEALVGDGINASITDEDAYLGLLEAFAADKATASRVREKRAAIRAEDEERDHEAAVQEPAVVVRPELEEPGAQTEVPRPETEPEPEPEPEQKVDAEPEIEPEPVLDAEAEPEAEEAVDFVEDEAESEEEPTVAVEPEAEELEAVDEPELVEDEAAGIDVTQELEAVPEQDAPSGDGEAGVQEPDEVLSARRYQLTGTKVVGRIDLKDVEDKDAKRKRKRKRKRKTTEAAPAEVEAKTAVEVAARETDARKRKRKRGPSVDAADVTQTLQETLRELEQGAGRVRQRRRRQRREERAASRLAEAERDQASGGTLKVTEFVSTGELAKLMDVPVAELIRTLFSSGMVVSINQRLDADTISFLADEFGMEVEFITDFGTDDIRLEVDKEEDLHPRAPIVTVMGHVDHGKTSLLDYIRSANVVAGEAGGITQHIGAYHVEATDNRTITFLDTPGHEAFTAMRARGAQATDVVILVVAADDAVMPQTVEAINHARAAEVPIVVAINKIDKPDSNPERVMQQLADHNVLVEQWGGKVQCAFVSAHTGEGVTDLLDRVLLEAELLELKANPNRTASGIVIESRLEKGRGNVSTVLVENGTLNVGDTFIAGIHSGRVRAMFDERERRIDHVGPARPALVLGFDGAAEVGDRFVVLEDEREARDIAQRRQQIHREQALRQRKHITLDEIGRRLALGDFRELNLIIKADVGGSVEALTDALLKLSTEEVAVSIIHSGVGAITESDVMLASASDAVIIGFNVRPIPGARMLAEREEIDIRTYSIIYNAIEEVRDALEGLLSPLESERTLGSAEVRETFKVPKAGTVAGCYVVDGRIHRNDRIRLVREGVVIYHGSISSLRRFKEDVREVQSGYECGISIENYGDVKVGDQIEAFEVVETKRTLEV